ncbi:MAG: low temperature requirement protein A [Tetrasphaera sp.]|nr:low temperature requirement protein A [Tetrasphaera sp.]
MTVSSHPGHIAERYGLFTIIVLGETILAVASAWSRWSREDSSLRMLSGWWSPPW